KALLDARAERDAGKISVDRLRAAEDEAIRGAVKLQEDIGLQVATDGEFRRRQWHTDFLKSFGNVKTVPPSISVKFHTEKGDMEMAPPGLKVAGKLGRPRPIFVDAFKFLKSATRVTPKVTIPSPSTMHFRGGRGAVDTTAYPDMAEFYADLGRVYAEEIAD